MVQYLMHWLQFKLDSTTPNHSSRIYRCNVTRTSIKTRRACWISSGGWRKYRYDTIILKKESPTRNHSIYSFSTHSLLNSTCKYVRKHFDVRYCYVAFRCMFVYTSTTNNTLSIFPTKERGLRYDSSKLGCGLSSLRSTSHSLYFAFRFLQKMHLISIC